MADSSLECFDKVCLATERKEFKSSAEDGSAPLATAGDDPIPTASGQIINDNDKPKRKNKMATSSATDKSPLQKLHTQKEMDSFILSNEMVIVEFMTSWCGACKSIEPLFEELSSASLVVQSAQVMCDKNRETKKLAAAYGVSSYPVFIIFENGKTSRKWNGADRGKLESIFDEDRRGGKGGRHRSGKGGRSKR